MAHAERSALEMDKYNEICTFEAVND